MAGLWPFKIGNIAIIDLVNTIIINLLSDVYQTYTVGLWPFKIVKIAIIDFENTIKIHLFVTCPLHWQYWHIVENYGRQGAGLIWLKWKQIKSRKRYRAIMALLFINTSVAFFYWHVVSIILGVHGFCNNLLSFFGPMKFSLTYLKK